VTVAARVVHAGEVPSRADSAGVLSVRPTLGPHTGFAALEQAVLECAPGRSQRRTAGAAEETLFVLAGTGVLHLAGAAYALEPEIGVYVAPGQAYELENSGPGLLRVVAVRIPDPEPPDAGAGAASVTTVRRLDELSVGAATSEREFRIVADPDSGLRSATHFVGYIPTTRAPDHFHTYDEVIYVLDGEGVLHSGGLDAPVLTGACIQLPARTVHCLENTGEQPMRVVAVFRPAGSPAAAYYPDGTPAYVAQPDSEAQ
jgi:mannose-6-phosphate isomerase-like protein (cupin superfamily)